MKTTSNISLTTVQNVYSGPERRLWELLMGEQIHIGGLPSSRDLAAAAGILPGHSGVDLCCASGAGMRFLLRFLKVAHMTGVDATPVMLELARERAADEGCMERVTFVRADVCCTGLAESSYDFVWGEDAWCYVGDKPRLIKEAVRVVRSGGTLAFTDWMLGPEEMTPSEAEECLQFMKFPSLLSLREYSCALEGCGCVIKRASDTGRFISHVQLYLEMAEKQLEYDVLKLIGFDSALLKAIMAGIRHLRDLALHGKIIQGMVVAAKK